MAGGGRDGDGGRAPFEFVWRNDELTDPPGDAPGRLRRRAPDAVAASPSSIRRAGSPLPGTDSGDVIFELEPQGDEVLLTLVHRRLPDRSTLLDVSAGWHIHLDVLGRGCAAATPAPFWDGWARLREEYDGRLPGLTRAAGRPRVAGRPWLRRR